VVLVVPEDVFGQRAPGPLPPAPALGCLPAAEPADADVRRVRDLVAAADRPVLIAGGRLAPGEAGRAALRAAADRHGLPVLTSNKHQDLLDNRSPWYAGHLHVATQPAQRELLAEADLVLAVGTRLDQVTSQGYRWPAAPLPDQPLVHVHPDPAVLGALHRPALGLACDATAFLRRFAAAEPAGVAPAWADRLHRAEEELAAWSAVRAPDGVVFGAAVAELSELTGGGLVCTVDAGNFTSWVHRHLRFSGRGRLLGVGSSAMGFGVPAAVAAALRLPGQPVVAVVGDGGMLMTGNELATAVARRLRLTVLIADNGSYGTIRQHQERAYPGRVVGTDLANPDFAAVARAYGAYGEMVSGPDQVRPALARALAHPGPSVVHVRTSLIHISAYQQLPRPAAAAAGEGER
jgi:acetolactate synthase-1/2/3 large subunit